MLRDLASRIMAGHTDADPRRIADLFAGETGYATPKIDVRAAVFDVAGRILMVREAADGGRWTLPGGWADVNQTVAESAAREVVEESGYVAEVRKLAAVWDRTRQGHPSAAFSCAKFFFICALTGGSARTSLETTGIAWFAETAIPADLSLGRVLPRQIARVFAHWHDPGLPTEFE
jgi:ADP-ribose pyrophosphatase YjhB (NUDIX family)